MKPQIPNRFNPIFNAASTTTSSAGTDGCSVTATGATSSAAATSVICGACAAPVDASVHAPPEWQN